MPDNPNKPYDMKELILKTVDDGDFFELQPDYAKNIIIGLPAWTARPWWASWPTSRWCWPVAWTSSRASRPRVCALLRCVQHPVVTFVDVPGFMPAPARNTAASSSTAPSCSTPTLSAPCEDHRHHPQGLRWCLRRDGLKHLRGDVNLAWPNAEIAVMGAKGAVEIIFREDKNDPAKLAPAKPNTKRFANPFVAGARGFIDDVILPHETRKRICRSLVMLQNKKIENPGASTETRHCQWVWFAIVTAVHCLGAPNRFAGCWSTEPVAGKSHWERQHVPKM